MIHDDDVSGGRGMLVYTWPKPLIDRALTEAVPARETLKPRDAGVYSLLVAVPTLNTNPFLLLPHKEEKQFIG